MAFMRKNKVKQPPFIILWLGFFLTAGFATTAWTASEDSGDSNQTVAIRSEPAFEHNLKRFTDVVKKAKRIEVLVYGPYRDAKNLKNCKICPEFILDAAKHAEEAQMQTLCRDVLDSIKSGTARPPKPVASLVLESDEEPYYQFVSGLVRDYWKSLEPAYYDFALKINRGDKKNADESMKQKRQDLEWNYLDRKNYGSVTLRSFSLEPPPGKTIDVPRQRYMLYENGMAVDGSKRYLQSIYYIPLLTGMPLDTPMRDILAVHYFDISPEFIDYSGSFGTYSASGKIFGHHIALGVLFYQGLALPWVLTKPDKKSLVPKEFKGQHWRYIADINSAIGINRQTGITCTYGIQ